jgi:hypothetical protein
LISRGQDEGDNKSIKGESLSKNEDKDKPNKETFLLCIGSDSDITNDSNGISSGLVKMKMIRHN